MIFRPLEIVGYIGWLLLNRVLQHVNLNIQSFLERGSLNAAVFLATISGLVI